MTPTVKLLPSRFVIFFGAFLRALFFLPFFISALSEQGPKIWHVFFTFACACLLFGFAAFAKRYFLPALKGQIALELNNDGIINYTDGYSIEWTNVKEIRFEKLWPNRVIAIELKDEKKVTSQVKNVLIKLYMFNESRLCGTRIVINTMFLRGKRKDIMNTLSVYLAKSRIWF